MPKGHKASPASFSVCIPKGIPTMVTISNKLATTYSSAVMMPPNTSHNTFIKQPMSSIFRDYGAKIYILKEQSVAFYLFP